MCEEVNIDDSIKIMVKGCRTFYSIMGSTKNYIHANSEDSYSENAQKLYMRIIRIHTWKMLQVSCLDSYSENGAVRHPTIYSRMKPSLQGYIA